MVDEAHCIGLPDATDSYLNKDKIIGLAKELNVDAIHPGYGFLSEDSSFVKLVSDNGIIFIGPSPNVISRMGDKIEAKKIAQQLNIPTVPGKVLSTSSISIQVEEIKQFAEEVGYPVLIKAAAGGGGRGMRQITPEVNIEHALQGAQNEALKFFGDGTVFLEKLILKPRHIEVQIFGDAHGDVIHLGTRDCTYQRNNQKVIEEAPAPGLSDSIREELERSAIRIGKEANYTNAGTVEFLLVEDNFYFIEVNSRLQVEHPVTEILYGIDLVEWQLRIASGEKLPSLKSPKGHAIETRVCAEIPSDSFRISTGRIHGMHLPAARVDRGIEIGTICSHYYDSLVSKVICHNESREAAIESSMRNLNSFFIAGVETNISFLLTLLADNDFQSNTHYTKLIEERYNHPPQISKKSRFIAHLLFRLTSQCLDRGIRIEREDKLDFDMGGTSHKSLCTVREDPAEFLDSSGFKWRIIESEWNEEAGYNKIVLDGYDNALTIYFRIIRDLGWFTFNEGSFFVQYNPQRKKDTSGGFSSGEIYSPLPGKIARILSSENTTVKEGEVVLILESMKIEHTILATKSGVIKNISVTPGSTVEKGTFLLEIT